MYPARSRRAITMERRGVRTSISTPLLAPWRAAFSPPGRLARRGSGVRQRRSGRLGFALLRTRSKHPRHASRPQPHPPKSAPSVNRPLMAQPAGVARWLRFAFERPNRPVISEKERKSEQSAGCQPWRKPAQLPRAREKFLYEGRIHSQITRRSVIRPRGMIVLLSMRLPRLHSFKYNEFVSLIYVLQARAQLQERSRTKRSRRMELCQLIRCFSDGGGSGLAQ